MDAASLGRRALPVGLLALAAAGCVGPTRVAPEGPAPALTTPAARSQAPIDEPKAPVGKIVLTNATPTPTPTPTPGVTQASLSNPSNTLRDKQIQVAAFIGTTVVITDDEVWQMVRQRGAEYMDLFGGEQAKKEKAIYKEELRKLIERELIILELYTRMKANKATDKIEGLNDMARETANKRMAGFSKARNLSEADFVKVLRSQGLTYNGIRRQLERDALTQVYLEQMLKDKAKFVTLNDIWDYYTANPKEFAVPEQVKWLDCFVSFQRFGTLAEAKTYAESLWRTATTGGDFSDMVKKSGHGDSGLRGGEGVGTKRGEFQPAELESIILDMKPGQVSSLLQTATGYHIVKVVSVQKAGSREFDAKVQTEIRSKLTKQLQEKDYAKMVDDFWRRYQPRVVAE